MNYYQAIADYYDLLMDGGYYEHKSLAKSIQSVISQRKRVLELGIGTGRLAEELLRNDSSYDFVGIDFSPAMIGIAKERLCSHSVLLTECDVSEMSLDRKFDVAVSCGGTWVIVRSVGQLLLGTHLFNKESDLRGLQNVSDHVVSGGLLMLSLHPPHEDQEFVLADGIIYSQKIKDPNEESDHFFLEKTYSFSKGGEILAEETLTLGFYKDTVFLRMLADVGFEPLGMTDAEDFFVFEKTM